MLAKDKKTAVHASIQSQAFDRAWAQINRLSAADHNQADAKTPIDSILAFLLEEAVRVNPLSSALATDPADEQLRRRTAALEKILERHPFAPLDAMIARHLSPKDSESFTVPLTRGPPAQGTVISVLAPFVFRFGNDLLPQGSWPWLVLREAALCLANKGQYADVVLHDVYESDHTGPVGYEAIARLLDLANSPARGFFASRGLTRLSAGDFRHDYELLLDSNCVSRQCLVNLALGLAGLDDGELEALAGLFSPDNAALLRRSVQLLRQNTSQTLAETLSPVLNEVWDKRLKQMIETDLLKLAKPPATNAPSVPAPPAHDVLPAPRPRRVAAPRSWAACSAARPSPPQPPASRRRGLSSETGPPAG